MSDFVYLQTAPDTIIVGEAPFTFVPAPLPGQFNFYINDFFLRSTTPWVIAGRTLTLSRNDFVSRFQSARLVEGEITWKSVADSHFPAAFSESQELFQKGSLQKIIPIIFEHGTIPNHWGDSTLEILTSRNLAASTSPYAFGYSFKGEGICGITPETLFILGNSEIRTVALAGTKKASLGSDAIDNDKDSREHEIVIEDLRVQLQSLGKVLIGETSPETVGSLIHLRTPVHVTLSERISFNDVVSLLHPTAALGAYPRSALARELLERWDQHTHRGFFGSPIGIQLPTGDAFCFVAIRCVQWDNQSARIGSGCGVITESQLTDELAELHLKRESVKARVTYTPL